MKKVGVTLLQLHPLFLFDFDFLFHVYLFLLVIGEFVLKEGETLIGDNLDAESVFHLPLTFHGNESLVDEGSDVRMDVQGKFLDLQFVDQVVNLAFQCVRKEYGRFDGSFSEAGGAGFIGGDVHDAVAVGSRNGERRLVHQIERPFIFERRTREKLHVANVKRWE